MSSSQRADIIAGLRTEILHLQGFHSSSNSALDEALRPLNQAFANGSFPLSAVHEFLSLSKEDVAATCGFLVGLVSNLMGNNGVCVWISSSRTLFPPALKSFGIDPDRFVFIDLGNEKEVIWAMDEALKCGSLTCAVGETKEINFTESRRFQLAVERSRVTGFILRHCPHKLNATACVSRWRINSLPSNSVDGLPGIGFPRWRVELLRIRNGKPGVWDLEWCERKFRFNQHPSSNATQELPNLQPLIIKKAG